MAINRTVNNAPFPKIQLNNVRVTSADSIGHDIQSLVLDSVYGSIKAAIRAGVAQSTYKISRGFLPAIREEFRSNATGELLKIHTDVAKSMQQSVLRSYATLVERERLVQPYERSNRLSGHLRTALESDQLILVGKTGITFPNTKFLDAEAAHWRRLNFGTQGRSGTRPAQTFYLDLSVFDSATKLAGRLPVALNAAPSPGFSIPLGVFGDGNDQSGPTLGSRFNTTTQQFKVISGKKFYPTRGIAGRSFLDAGLRTATEELPPLYKGLATRFVSKAAAEARKNNSSVRVSSGGQRTTISGSLPS